ncbi:MAG: uroporphyrinogen decarboxylase family protein [Clostridia bacterium]|nr:uroporphyrinogen decarboxylase family protein [Clostridia bacterium]
MKYDMKAWLAGLKKSGRKKALPILSFPCISLMGITVRELLAGSGLQAEGMRAVAERTDAAAAVSFMDLSVEAECFGAQVRFSDHEVPAVIGQLVTGMDDAEGLKVPGVGAARSGVFIDAIRLAKEKITDRPVLAGMIGPFSLAARLMDMTEIMISCYEEPEMVETVLEKATDFLCEYAKAYKAAGADGIMMAEPVAGLLAPTLLEAFSAPYVRRIADAVQDDQFAVIYHNCGGNTIKAIDAILSSGCAAYHFGNAIDMKEMLGAVPEGTIVIGNLDPAGVLRLGTPGQVREETLRIMQECCACDHFVISTGCDVPPMTPWENIDAFFDAVKEYYDER